MWCSGIPSSQTLHKEGSEIRPGCYPAYQHTWAQERIVLSKFQKDSKRSVITPKEPQTSGRGMTRCTDKHFAKKMAGGLGLEGLALHSTSGSPEGYHSAREPSDFDNDIEEELQDVESKEEPLVESDNSDTSSVQSGPTSLCSQPSTTESRDRKRTRGRLRAMC